MTGIHSTPWPTRVVLVGGPLDGASSRLAVSARLEAFLVGRVPAGVTVRQFETALRETGAANSPAGKRALMLLASRVSVARYRRGRSQRPVWWRPWCRIRRYRYVDQALLWVCDTDAGPRLALTTVPDHPRL